MLAGALFLDQLEPPLICRGHIPFHIVVPLDFAVKQRFLAVDSQCVLILREQFAEGGEIFRGDGSIDPGK